jgi:hypothetical protein
VHGLILASVPSNTEAGSYLTFGGPVGLFCIVITILWLLFSRPHPRVPPRRALAPSKAGTSGTGNVSGTTAGSEAAADETPGPDKNTEASE